MNPIDRSIYNLLNDERRNLITQLPNMHKQARIDALKAIRKVTMYMRHLMTGHPVRKET